MLCGVPVVIRSLPGRDNQYRTDQQSTACSTAHTVKQNSGEVHQPRNRLQPQSAVLNGGSSNCSLWVKNAGLEHAALKHSSRGSTPHKSPPQIRGQPWHGSAPPP